MPPKVNDFNTYILTSWPCHCKEATRFEASLGAQGCGSGRPSQPFASFPSLAAFALWLSAGRQDCQGRGSAAPPGWLHGLDGHLEARVEADGRRATRRWCPGAPAGRGGGRRPSASGRGVFFCSRSVSHSALGSNQREEQNDESATKINVGQEAIDPSAAHAGRDCGSAPAPASSFGRSTSEARRTTTATFIANLQR